MCISCNILYGFLIFSLLGIIIYMLWPFIYGPSINSINSINSNFISFGPNNFPRRKILKNENFVSKCSKKNIDYDLQSSRFISSNSTDEQSMIIENNKQRRSGFIDAPQLNGYNLKFLN